MANIPRLTSDIINEKESYLWFLSDKYHFRIQLKEKIEKNREYVIVLTIEKESIIESFAYQIEMNYNEFCKYNLFKLFSNTEEIYNFISNLIEEKRISIKTLGPKDSIVLTIKTVTIGVKNPFIVDIKLFKKKGVRMI